MPNSSPLPSNAALISLSINFFSSSPNLSKSSSYLLFPLKSLKESLVYSSSSSSSSSSIFFFFGLPRFPLLFVVSFLSSLIFVFLSFCFCFSFFIGGTDFDFRLFSSFSSFSELFDSDCFIPNNA